MKTLNSRHLRIHIALSILFLAKRILLVQSLSSALKLVNNKDEQVLTTRRHWGDQIFSGVTTVLGAPTLVWGSSAREPATAAPTEPSAASTRLWHQRPHLTEEYFWPGTTAPQAGRFFFPTLTPPFQNRATYRYTLGRQAWAFEQLLTFVNVTATIRCNVVQLQNTGGLWVHSPQWPTGEFCYLLEDLGAPVEHIVLPCNALEHKAPMKAFVNRYPDAQVWISPGQYGPFGECGQNRQESIKMNYRVDGILGDFETKPPWANEFDMATLYVDLPQNAGPVSEVAFCHRPSKTLIATDAVVFISSNTTAPEIFSTYFDQDTLQDPTFWPRTACQAVFLPLRTDERGNYPGFDAVKDQLVRAPILRAFADGRAPNAVRDWSMQISQWDFDRILTSHFASPIAASPLDFQGAYGYLTSDLDNLPPIACSDWELLDGLNQIIAEYRLGAPAVFNYKVGCQ